MNSLTDFSIQNQNPIPYTPDDYNFVASVIDYITGSMKLPLLLDSSDVFSAILNKVTEYYDICPWATVDDKIIARLDYMNRPVKQFLPDAVNSSNPDAEAYEIANDTIILPGVVEEVFDVRWFQKGYGYIGAFNYSSWKLEAMLSGGVINSYHNMIGSDTYMAAVYINNTLRSMSVETVAYNFNPLTKEMKIFDESKRHGFIEMEVARRIPLVDLYKDRWFRDYIASYTIILLCENISLFDAKLPGDLNLNVGDVKKRGEDLRQKTYEYLEQETEHHFNFIKA